MTTTKEIIAKGLTYNTLQKAVKHYQNIGEQDVTLERAQRLLEEHFGYCLDLHFATSIGRGDQNFEREKQVILSKIPAMGTFDKEELVSILWGIYEDGFSAGYSAGVKDTETTLYFLDDVETEG